jgi:hypothetical protein
MNGQTNGQNHGQTNGQTNVFLQVHKRRLDACVHTSFIRISFELMAKIMVKLMVKLMVNRRCEDVCVHIWFISCYVNSDSDIY